MIYTINMHTTLYQFWRFVYHHEQSVIDHYARSSLYTRSFCTGIKLYVGYFLWSPPPPSFCLSSIFASIFANYLYISEISIYSTPCWHIDRNRLKMDIINEQCISLYFWWTKQPKKNIYSPILWIISHNPGKHFWVTISSLKLCAAAISLWSRVGTK